jgi:dinuclear metal center YbgI/SA1388 family protein
MKIRKIMELLESFAPARLAYDWDNVGLLLGELESEVSNILLALEVTPSIADYAIKEKFDLIITHHPLFLKPLHRINDPLIFKLIRNGVSLYSMHSNLDIIREGVNKALADKIGLQNLEFINRDTRTFHIALYVPPVEAQRVAEAVHQAGAGVIGNYSHCLNSYTVDGQFKPLSGSNPTIGETGEMEKMEEMKLEFFVDEPLLQKVIQAIENSHPYETPAYAISTLEQKSLNYGLGIIGVLKKPTTLRILATETKKALKANFVKLWPANESPDKKVRKVAVCGGSGSSLIDSVTGRADVFISADFTYHKILESRIPLIDAGHYFTEYPVLQVLKDLLLPLKIRTEIMEIGKGDAGKLLCF